MNDWDDHDTPPGSGRYEAYGPSGGRLAMARQDEVILVCGGRGFNDVRLLSRVLDDKQPKAIAHGDCPTGADFLSGVYARERGIPEIRVPANWQFYGKKAGPIRNSWMPAFIRIKEVVSFPGGKGTADMVAKARAAGIPVHEVKP